MGKTFLACDVLKVLEGRSYYTRYESMKDLDSARACRRVMRVAREVRAAPIELKAPRAVVFDDMPPIDECDLGKVARAFERMVARNTLVLVCMLPEAEALAEEADGCQVFLSPDMADLYRLDFAESTQDHRLSTRDIASLVYAGEKNESSHVSAYLLWKRALADLAAALLRHTLPREELELRLAMMVLGSGTFDELKRVARRADEEALKWLSRDTPFFGIDLAQGTFDCVGLDDPQVLEACMEKFLGMPLRLSATVVQAANILAARGEFTRLAEVSRLCSDEDLVELGCAWGVELVCAGQVRLVAKALELHEKLEFKPSVSQDLSAFAVACVEARVAAFDLDKDIESLASRSDGEKIPNLAEKIRLASLLRAARAIDCGSALGRVLPMRDDTDMARELVRHVQARRHILCGRFTEAYALLVNDPLRLLPNSLVAAWLCEDFAIAQAFVAETSREPERAAFDEAGKTMTYAGSRRLLCYHDIIDPMLASVVGRSTTLEGGEEAVALASRMGDTMLQAVVLLALAVIDNRQGAFARAHVRAVQAGELTGPATGRKLRIFAQFIDALSAMGLGDQTPLSELARRTKPSTVRDLASYFVCQDLREVAEIAPGVLVDTNATKDAIWMLNMLCNDFGALSASFRESIPAQWLALSRKSIRGLRRYSASSEEKVAAAPVFALLGSAEKREPQEPSVIEGDVKPLGITLLGDFCLSLGGVRLSGMGLTSRRTRSLITFLAMRRGHMMRRFELIECIWPETDFDLGRQRVYEAVSYARAMLKKANDGVAIDPFIVNKAEGALGLNMDIVTCDVDQFERLAHAALAEEDDARAISMAMSAVSTYRGDLCETPFDATGMAANRREELRSLFIDVSVAGANAAIREDCLQLGVRMAWKAHELSKTREDVVMVLVEALRLSGRVVDAKNVYLTFARNLLEETGSPPSASMRAAMARFMDELGESKPKPLPQPVGELVRMA